MALYSEKVMDHFMNPRNVGCIEDADGVGEIGNAKCGDIMKIYLKIENDIIVDCKFETFGCGSAIASSSMATEMIMLASGKHTATNCAARRRARILCYRIYSLLPSSRSCHTGLISRSRCTTWGTTFRM